MKVYRQETARGLDCIQVKTFLRIKNHEILYLLTVYCFQYVTFPEYSLLIDRHEKNTFENKDISFYYTRIGLKVSALQVEWSLGSLRSILPITRSLYFAKEVSNL